MRVLTGWSNQDQVIPDLSWMTIKILKFLKNFWKIFEKSIKSF